MSMKKKKKYRDILLQLPRLLLVCSVVTAGVTGILISCYYIPVPDRAAGSLDYINEQVFAGAMILSIHRLSGVFALLFTLCNLLIILPAENISASWWKIWRSGLIICITLTGLQISGYILTGSVSAAHLLKAILTGIFKTGNGSAALPQLPDSLSFAFMRVHVLHAIILPALTGWFLYHHVQSMKQVHSEFKPFPLPPLVVYAFFCTVAVIAAFFISESPEPVGTYGDPLFAHAPWSVSFLLSVRRVLPLSVTIPAGILLFILLWFFGLFFKRLKT